jgi:hypothetical protein
METYEDLAGSASMAYDGKTGEHLGAHTARS